MKITAVIPHYHWERNESLKKAINALRNQTRPPDEILVWDNEGSTLEVEGAKFLRSPFNIGPAARFWASGLVATDLVFYQDNDVMVGPTTLEDLLKWRQRLPNAVLSLHGYNVEPGGSYAQRQYIINVGSPARVNITLGKAELVSSEVPRAALGERSDRESMVMDDLWFSSRLRDLGIPIYVVPGVYINLPGWKGGASALPDHYARREVLFPQLFPKGDASVQ